MTKRTVSIETTDKIHYVALDPTPGGSNLGCAEFQFCPVWKRGTMRELLIFPKQQRVKVGCYRLPLPSGITTFLFRSEHPHDDPWAWRMSWCKEHKTVSYEVYVPDGTDTLSFELHFGNSIDICFRGRS